MLITFYCKQYIYFDNDLLIFKDLYVAIFILNKKFNRENPNYKTQYVYIYTTTIYISTMFVCTVPLLH